MMSFFKEIPIKPSGNDEREIFRFHLLSPQQKLKVRHAFEAAQKAVPLKSKSHPAIHSLKPTVKC